MYNIKKNKNLIISSSILAGINCNNIYCGYYGDTKNGTGGEKDKKGETPNGDKGKKKPTPEEIEKNRQNTVNDLMYLFNDKKAKLTKLGRQNELKITEEQIKGIKNKNDFQNIINELNKIEIISNPVGNVVLDVNNIHNETYILKLSELCKGETNAINFCKFINDDKIPDEKFEEVIEKLVKENKLYNFTKYDPSMSDEDENKRNKYLYNNTYLLYIDKDTFSIKDGIKLEEITYTDFSNRIISNSKNFENCYFLYTSLEKDEDIITIFKKKTIIDLDKLNSYPNIFCFIPSEDSNATDSRFKEFLKKFNIKVEDKGLGDYYDNNAIHVHVNDNKSFGIFNSTIDEIEFKGYKKLTEKPEGYGAIDITKKFEIGITDSKGTTKYYFVKEEAK